MNFSEITNINIPEGVVSKITTLEGVVLWEKGDSDIVIPDLPTPLANEIYYISKLENIVELSSDYSGVQPISNTYENGIGKMVFAENLNTIGDYMFYYNIDLLQVRLPNNITKIGKSCFQKCSFLEYINIPTNVITIDEYAFRECGNLLFINIPNSVTSIGRDSFAYCTDLKSINIPNSVTSVGNYCFENCNNLTEVKLSNQLTKIPNYCFAFCKKIYNIVLPSSIKTIESSAFFCCTYMQSIDIPSSVTSIGDYTFTFDDYNGSYLEQIICRCKKAPTITSKTFKNVGNNCKYKTLYIPNNASGYDTWLQYLKGFTIEYITE